jgi:Adenylosuccinate synthetase
MFRNIFQSAASTRVFAGAALATAGSTIVWANNNNDDEVSSTPSSSMSAPFFFTLHNPFAPPHVTHCEEAPSNATVIGLLQELTKKVTNMETIIGGGTAGVASTTKGKRKHGIDIVLGAQWGDEGKGKLVDMLSQVRDFFGQTKKEKRLQI